MTAYFPSFRLEYLPFLPQIRWTLVTYIGPPHKLALVVARAAGLPLITVIILDLEKLLKATHSLS